MSALAALEARIAALEERIAHLVLAGGGTDSVRLIQLTQTGGAAGDTEDPTTWTYTVSDLAGNTIATAIDPTEAPHIYRRMTLGPYTAATYGVMIYHDDHEDTWDLGPWCIAWINEVPAIVVCVPPEEP